MYRCGHTSVRSICRTIIAREKPWPVFQRPFRGFDESSVSLHRRFRVTYLSRNVRSLCIYKYSRGDYDTRLEWSIVSSATREILMDVCVCWAVADLLMMFFCLFSQRLPPHALERFDDLFFFPLVSRAVGFVIERDEFLMRIVQCIRRFYSYTIVNDVKSMQCAHLIDTLYTNGDRSFGGFVAFDEIDETRREWELRNRLWNYTTCSTTSV